jgi:hypothetical protein
MTTYVQNYGFTKTTMKNNGSHINNEIKWNGEYDGKVANLDVNINDNGHKEVVSLQLTNNDLIELFGTKPVEMSLDERLYNDFLLTNVGDNDTSTASYSPMVLEGALINKPPQTRLNMSSYRMKNKVKHKSKKHRRINTNTHKRRRRQRQTYRH